ncbi:ribosome biogenesis GTP-binding protein YihA/YsxC [Arundinibacter roseus]|uniref:Probable GTP-binding protein EngB n=1 Tax=Arundinibacter roseus TaxID=2070510 RepID=A0A4R4K7X6_9BACT|nr:ribosome biogenesis GTP-binding protein YihA/YsxC [Arundinibacter roseus]TDB63640.1 YihA family ribosome biogenesis GTP-binding protein [Arundinibacter roseus]
MIIQEAKYIMSNADYRQCPAPELPEYAFIGRSNVGKSSLINMLTQRKALAKTSQHPGKTQLINHFLINSSWYLVDLPGYGYAKVSKSERDKWERMIYEYLRYRPNLQCIFVLVDSRHDPQRVDLEFMESLGEEGIPFHIVFTKTDKMKASAVPAQIARYQEKLLETWEELPVSFITSAEEGVGREGLLETIRTYNDSFVRSERV